MWKESIVETASFSMFLATCSLNGPSTRMAPVWSTASLDDAVGQFDGGVRVREAALQTRRHPADDVRRKIERIDHLPVRRARRVTRVQSAENALGVEQAGRQIVERPVDGMAVVARGHVDRQALRLLNQKPQLLDELEELQERLDTSSHRRTPGSRRFARATGVCDVRVTTASASTMARTKRVLIANLPS